jgi:hypothetical protein
LKRWIWLYNYDYSDSLDYLDVDEWDVSKFVKPECGKKIFDYLLYKDLYDHVSPIPDAVWGVNMLREFGFTAMILFRQRLLCINNWYKFGHLSFNLTRAALRINFRQN